MAKRTDPIGVFDSGVFDSGVGGISVLRALLHKMPGENYLYYGDSANAPYGTRSPEDVTALASNVAQKLASQGVKALVVACNTSTSVAMETLRKNHPELIVVGIEPYRTLWAPLKEELPRLRIVIARDGISDIELCFRALYATMLYRIKGDQSKAGAIEDVVSLVSPVVALLAQTYLQVERGEVDLFGK